VLHSRALQGMHAALNPLDGIIPPHSSAIVSTRSTQPPRPVPPTSIAVASGCRSGPTAPRAPPPSPPRPHTAPPTPGQRPVRPEERSGHAPERARAADDGEHKRRRALHRLARRRAPPVPTHPLAHDRRLSSISSAPPRRPPHAPPHPRRRRQGCPCTRARRTPRAARATTAPRTRSAGRSG
jgi:hypothetical protein